MAEVYLFEELPKVLHDSAVNVSFPYGFTPSEGVKMDVSRPFHSCVRIDQRTKTEQDRYFKKNNTRTPPPPPPMKQQLHMTEMPFEYSYQHYI